MIVCASCGEENSDRARFCQACAAPIAPTPVGSEERRVVSVLFVDLVGFTARAERLDPEDVRAILSRYHERARAEIERFGGTVEKFVGDAVMAVFGAPVMHGDDPERAVRAGLAVRDALLEMDTEDPALDLQIRAAVNTGEAIVALGARPDRGEAMLAGDVVNTASRLQSAAPVNAVIVGEETFLTTRAMFDYRQIGSIDAKGKAEALLAWLAVAPMAPVGERSFSEVPIVGRGEELAALRGIWERVAAERKPHLVTVFGPSGIGKSRLAHELGERVATSGGRAMRGRSVGYGGSSPYSAFAHHVKQIAGIYDNDDVAAAREKLTETVAELTPSESAAETAQHIALLIGLGSDGGVSDRETLFFAARLMLEGFARRTPTMLLFEDIHWADPSLLDLISFLASRVRDVPLLLVSTARAEFLSARGSWGGGLPAYSAIPLEPLRESESVELARRLLAQRGLEELSDRASALASTGEGNPLFLEELTATLAERSSDRSGQLPTSIRGIVGARLDALPAPERDVLLDASVVGKVFWRGAVAELGPDRSDLSDLLGSLEQRDLIRREAVSGIRGEQQFIFKHGLIRDVAYLTLPRAERRQRHAAVARFLEGATPDPTARAESLAYHWKEAGDQGRALDYLLTAAEQAGRGWAKERALRLYQEALELVPDDDTERRREIFRRQAVMAAAAYHVPDAERLQGRQGGPPQAV